MATKLKNSHAFIKEEWTKPNLQDIETLANEHPDSELIKKLKERISQELRYHEQMSK